VVKRSGLWWRDPVQDRSQNNSNTVQWQQWQYCFSPLSVADYNSPKLTITQVYYSIVNEGEATREVRKNETEVYREVARQRSFGRPLLDIVVPFLSSRTRTASTVWEKDHENSLFHSARCDTIIILARARRLRQNGTTPMPRKGYHIKQIDKSSYIDSFRKKRRRMLYCSTPLNVQRV